MGRCSLCAPPPPSPRDPGMPRSWLPPGGQSQDGTVCDKVPWSPSATGGERKVFYFFKWKFLRFGISTNPITPRELLLPFALCLSPLRVCSSE